MMVIPDHVMAMERVPGTIQDEFNAMQRWINEQKEVLESATIACAKIDGEWTVLESGKSDVEVYDNLDIYLKEHPGFSFPIIFQ